MIDPKRMERLWAACPELRPGGLVFHDDWSSYHHGNAWGLQRHYILPEVAESLIRDKCVWWLAEESLYFVPVAHSPRANKIGGWCFQLMGSDMAKEHLWCESGTNLGPDPTEACLLACERVLGLPEWNATTSPPGTHTPPG